MNERGHRIYGRMGRTLFICVLWFYCTVRTAAVSHDNATIITTVPSKIRRKPLQQDVSRRVWTVNTSFFICVQHDRNKLKPITMKHIDVLPQCLPTYPSLWLLGCCSSSDVQPTRVHPGICILYLTLRQHSRGWCLRTFTMEAITAYDMLPQEWQLPRV